jgi:hypothetical protein
VYPLEVDVARHSFAPLALGAAALILVSLSGCAPSSSSSGPKPVIDSAKVDADNYIQASGHIEGVAESGGKCKFTLTAKNGEASRLVSTGKIAGDRTDCGSVNEHATMVKPGTYSLVLSYQPAGAVPGGQEAESEAQDIEIPDSTK